MGLKTFLTTRGLFEEAKGGLYYCLFLLVFTATFLYLSQKNSTHQSRILILTTSFEYVFPCCKTHIL